MGDPLPMCPFVDERGKGWECRVPRVPYGVGLLCGPHLLGIGMGYLHGRVAPVRAQSVQAGGKVRKRGRGTLHVMNVLFSFSYLYLSLVLPQSVT